MENTKYQCSICKQEKELTEFNCGFLSKTIRKDRRCRECRKKANAEYYKIHSYAKNRKDKTNYVNAIKSSGCCLCNEQSVVCIDFHHQDRATKSFTIGAITCNGEKLRNEIAKCILLCANCHRKVHAKLIDVSDIPTLVPPALDNECG